MIDMDKIDIVYLWCDGNDPAFQARKNQYMGNALLMKRSSENCDLSIMMN